MRPWLRWTLLVAIVAAVVGGMTLTATALTPATRTIDVLVVPHPDDEFQTWSLVEGRSHEYKVFAVMTHGEETGYCDEDLLDAALQAEQGEIVPSPAPAGRWSAECEAARQAAFLGFLSQMSESDPTIPGDFAPAAQVHGPVESDGTPICRVDDGTTRCDDAVRQVDVWLDARDRGAVVFFDLGDGDAALDEIAWALRSLVAHGTEWGLPDAPIGPMIGAFANDGRPCHSYPHPDHVAVHMALWHVDFGVGPQLGATCFLDSRQRMSAVVSPAGLDAAFALAGDGTRIGAHGRHYGWLHNEVYPLAPSGQSELFMPFQSFWIRFN